MQRLSRSYYHTGNNRNTRCFKRHHRASDNGLCSGTLALLKREPSRLCDLMQLCSTLQSMPSHDQRFCSSTETSDVAVVTAVVARHFGFAVASCRAVTSERAVCKAEFQRLFTEDESILLEENGAASSDLLLLSSVAEMTQVAYPIDPCWAVPCQSEAAMALSTLELLDTSGCGKTFLSRRTKLTEAKSGAHHHGLQSAKKRQRRQQRRLQERRSQRRLKIQHGDIQGDVNIDTEIAGVAATEATWDLPPSANETVCQHQRHQPVHPQAQSLPQAVAISCSRTCRTQTPDSAFYTCSSPRHRDMLDDLADKNTSVTTGSMRRLSSLRRRCLALTDRLRTAIFSATVPTAVTRVRSLLCEAEAALLSSPTLPPDCRGSLDTLSCIDIIGDCGQLDDAKNVLKSQHHEVVSIQRGARRQKFLKLVGRRCKPR